MSKRCPKCGVEKSASDFHKDRTKYDGLASRCKACRAGEESGRYQTQRDAILEQKAKYYRENLDARKAYNNGRYASRKDEFAAEKRAWRAANPDKMRLVNRKHYAKNGESVRAQNKAWALANPEVIAAISRRRKARKLGGVSEPYTRRQLLQIQGFRCFYCPSELEDDRTTHVDHVLPLSSGFAYDVPLNVRASCAPCNLSKGDRITQQSVDFAERLAQHYEDSDLWDALPDLRSRVVTLDRRGSDV